MIPSEQETTSSKDSSNNDKIELDENDDTTVANDVVVRGNNEEKEREQRIREQEMIQKAISFWNHPALRDVPSSEKRSYLREQQGLTNAQIHKVWEKMVEPPRDGLNYIIGNRLGSSTAGEYNTAVPQHHSHRQNHREHYDNRYPSPRLSPDPASGQNFNSYQAPFHQSSTSEYGYDYTNHAHLPNERHFSMEGSDGSISVARGLSLLGVGGFLGVTGAAAVRWMNGGRFELIPPPSNARSSAVRGAATSGSKISTGKPQTQGQSSFLQQETNQHGKQKTEVGKTHWDIDRDNNNEYDEEEEYNIEEYSDNDEDFDIEGCLLDRMDALLSSIDSNSVLQEKLILKLANTSTITDDSMTLLKENIGSTKSIQQSTITGTTDTSKMILSQLKEVKHDLASLSEAMMNNISSKSGHGNGGENEDKQDWRRDWSNVLSRFEHCIQALENPAVDSFVVDSDSKSISTAEITATDSVERKDQQSSLATPSTPAAETSSKNSIDSSASTTSSIPLSLKDCILKIGDSNDIMSIKSGSQLLYLYLANLSGKPDNRRYRKIFTSNESFQKVENLSGGKDLLRAVGFVEDIDKGVLEWVPTGSTEKEISSLVLVKEAAAALGKLKKPSNIPLSDLVRSALSELSLPFSAPHQSSSLLQKVDDEKTGDNQDDVPKTPCGSSLSSPPMPKKIPFVPTPSEIS